MPEEDDPTPPKLRIPHTAVEPVHRSRLLAALDDKTGDRRPRPVTVVSGPAGAGKTTLLATWARQLAQRRDKPRVVWVTIDARDNEPAVLRSAITNALSYGASSDLVEAVSAAGVPVYLILDEADHLTGENPLRSLETLVRQTPENLRLVLAARTPPRLHLSRLRLEGRLLEIGMPDLAFTTAETEALFAAHQVRLTPAELDQVMRRTEGWPAALRLAAMSLRDEATRPERLAAFPADDHALVDYLTEEVLGSHPDHVQQFLRATSICDTVSADLAAALAGQGNSGEILDRLDRANSLVDRIAHPGGWYRYHPVLRGVLLADLDRCQPFVRRKLHQTAAEWFRDSHHPTTALEHAISAGNDELINDLAETYGLQEILHGRAAELHLMLNGQPTGKHATLITAAAALDIGDLPSADRCLATLETSDDRLRTLHSTVTLHRAMLSGRITEPLDVLAAAAANRSGDPDLDTLSLLIRGTALLCLGELGHAERLLRRAHDLAAQGHREHAMLQSSIRLAAVAGARGELKRMDEQAAQAIEYATERGWAGTSQCAPAYAMRAAHAYLRLNGAQARQFSALAKEILRHTDSPVSPAALLPDSAIALDETVPSDTAIKQARDSWRQLTNVQVAPQLIAYAAPSALRIALRAGQQDWATEVAAHVDDVLPDTAEQALVTAVAHAHRGKPDVARRLLTPVLGGQAPAIVVTTLIDAWILEAAALADAEDWHRAHSAVTKALALAEPASAPRPFRDGGPAVRDLLVKGTGRFGKLDRFASAALARLPASPMTPVDQLTGREQDLLIELPSMRTTEEIADALFVSVNTVKTHLRGIYRKLGVNHRRDAVTVARQRGLL